MLTNNVSLRSQFIRGHMAGRRIPMFEDIGKVTPPADPPEGETKEETPKPVETTKVKTEVVKAGDKVIIDGIEFIPQAKVNELVGTARTEGKDAGRKELEDAANAAALKDQGKYKELYDGEVAKREELEGRLAKIELERVRERVAAKHNIPAEMALRLMGANEAELEADAKTMAKALGQPRKPVDTESGAGTHKGGGSGKTAGPKLNPPAWKQPGDVSWTT